MTELEAKQHEEETEEEHKQGRLTMPEALQIYLLQQCRLHRRAAAAAGKGADFACPTQIPLDGAGLLERQRLALDHLATAMDPDAKAVLDFWSVLRAKKGKK